MTHEPKSSKLPDVLRHYIGEIIYGANDGIVTTFAVVSGISGADLSPKIVVVLGLANLAADGFSMGASSFLSIRSAASAEQTDRGVREPLMHAAATFGAFVLFGAIPLLAYLLPGAVGAPFLYSCISSGAALFVVGALRALVLPRGWFRSGLEVLLIGTFAGAAAFGVGVLLGPVLRP